MFLFLTQQWTPRIDFYYGLYFFYERSWGLGWYWLTFFFFFLHCIWPSSCFIFVQICYHNTFFFINADCAILQVSSNLISCSMFHENRCPSSHLICAGRSYWISRPMYGSSTPKKYSLGTSLTESSKNFGGMSTNL